MNIKIETNGKFEHKDKILRILNVAVEAVNPTACVEKIIKFKEKKLFLGGKRIPLQESGNIYVIGIGKAVYAMALGIHHSLQDSVRAGYLLGKDIDININDQLPERYIVVKGGHPVPTKESIKSTKGLVEFLQQTREEDLVIFLVSGGGSALCTYPVEGIQLYDIRTTTALLLESGATINEFNTVRMHLDRIKGGGLLKYIHPAQSITLILSDVIGDDVSIIASGPTIKNTSTIKDVFEILKKYNIFNKLPPVVRKILNNKLNKEHFPEQISIPEKFKDHEHVIIGNISTAMRAACEESKNLGYKTLLGSSAITGEARVVGKQFALELRNLKSKFVDQTVCMIAGGETTVTISGSGKGGRNMELALSAAIEMKGMKNCALVSFATDGEDGPTDSAGAIVTGNTLELGMNAGVSAPSRLQNNDSYTYFQMISGMIRSGATGTNVNDLYLLFSFQ